MNRITKQLFLLALVLASNLLTACSAEDTRNVTFVGYNYTERPIFSYQVNGVGGGNIFINSGGGSWVCCGEVIVGQPAKIRWQYSYTKKQYEAGLREEDHETTVVVPEPKDPEASFLEVHFYPDHHVELALVKSPGDRRLPKIPQEN